MHSAYHWFVSAATVDIKKHISLCKKYTMDSLIYHRFVTETKSRHQETLIPAIKTGTYIQIYHWFVTFMKCRYQETVICVINTEWMLFL